jgi:hypothetical protein
MHVACHAAVLGIYTLCRHEWKGGALDMIDVYTYITPHVGLCAWLILMEPRMYVYMCARQVHREAGAAESAVASQGSGGGGGRPQVHVSHTCIHACIRACIHVYMITYLYIHAHTYLCIYTRTCGGLRGRGGRGGKWHCVM